MERNDETLNRWQEMDPGIEPAATPTQEQDGTVPLQHDLAERLQGLQQRLQHLQQGTAQDRGQEMDL